MEGYPTKHHAHGRRRGLGPEPGRPPDGDRGVHRSAEDERVVRLVRVDNGVENGVKVCPDVEIQNPSILFPCSSA